MKETPEIDPALPDSKTASRKRTPFTKTDLRYWQKAIFRSRYTQSGAPLEVQHYSARIQNAGRREIFALRSAGLKKAAAAEQAREIYLFLLSNGWEATLAKYKPSKALPAVRTVTTVGDLIREVKATSTGRTRTLGEYATRFRHIVAGIFNIEGGTEKHDYRTGGRQAWAEKVDAIKLRDVTPERIQKWKVDFLVRANGNPSKQRAARISVNSLLRQAKALFSPNHLQFVKLDGITSPFAQIKLEPRQSMRYRGGFDIESLVAQALSDLPKEELKVFLLASMGGLRRAEIDKLPWTAFNWERGTLQIETTEHFSAKSESSIGKVDLDPELVAMFRGFRAKATSPFVIESEIQPNPGASYAHFRCHRIFVRLNTWLRSHGVDVQRPLHALRKEFGSQINERHGIYAASQALRHADIAITAAHYLNNKTRATVGLGKLLQPNESVVPFKRDNAPQEGKMGLL